MAAKRLAPLEDEPQTWFTADWNRRLFRWRIWCIAPARVSRTGDSVVAAVYYWMTDKNEYVLMCRQKDWVAERITDIDHDWSLRLWADRVVLGHGQRMRVSGVQPPIYYWTHRQIRIYDKYSTTRFVDLSGDAFVADNR